MKLFVALIAILITVNANILQDAIDVAKAGSKLELPSGEYKGNIVIDKPLIIDGIDKSAKIIGDGNSTVIKIKSDYVTLKNLTITHSGSQHENVDAGVSVIKAKHVVIDNCKIYDTLFGIDFQEVDNSSITNNYIRSKDFELGLRGDAVRLWYSNDNNISNNHITHSRDMVVWYSHGNIISHNFGEYSRYSLHFMYAGKNHVFKNEYEHNSVGIFFMYSQDTIATDNIIKSSVGTTGLGIGLKDCSNFTLKNNTMIYCARGLYVDRSPFQPEQKNIIEGNKILYNAVGVFFHSLSINNYFSKNIFKGNMDTVYDDDEASLHAVKNHWVSNYWDNYEGFDKNRDGIGDTPYSLYYYADRMWMLNPNVKFFYGSSVVSIMNFLAKLAPLSEPVKLLEDKRPLMSENAIKGKI